MDTIKVDLHNHFTTKSRVLDVNRVADRVREALGPGGICALVNYADQRFEAFANRAGSYGGDRYGNAVHFPDRDVTITKGEEVPTLQGDVLVLGLEEGRHLTPGRELDYTLCEGRSYGGVNIIPHPCFHSAAWNYLATQRNFECAEDIDAFEIHNGNVSKRLNGKVGELWLHYMGLSGCGGLASSDGHSFREVGSSYTEILGFNFQDAKTLNDGLRTAVKMVSPGYKKTHSLWGPLVHMGILGSLMIADKMWIPVSRGDKESLR
mgnify:CR=1 FL=1